jgi:hypothetical protein
MHIENGGMKRNKGIVDAMRKTKIVKKIKKINKKDRSNKKIKKY